MTAAAKHAGEVITLVSILLAALLVYGVRAARLRGGR